MGFLFPKAKQPDPGPSAAMLPNENKNPVSAAINPGSLISTSTQGLTRKAKVMKSSLIGGAGSAN